MSKIDRISLIDRTVAHLREAIDAHRWTERLPGIRPLSVELGVSQHTLRAALVVLAGERLVSGGNAGESYRILRRVTSKPPADRKLAIGFLLRGKLETFPAGWRASLRQIADEAREAGHRCFFVPIPAARDVCKTGYLPRLVAKSGADTWFVSNGSREHLAWFADSGAPALAIGGRHHGLDIACASFTMTGAVRDTVRRLTGLGHRRIVKIIAETSRKPTPGPVATVLIEELARVGVRAGEYNLPQWDESPEGLETLLDSLFKVTPPTAIMCWPHEAAIAVLARLKTRGLRVPEDVSFFAADDNPCFGWLYPGLRVAHLRHHDDGIFRRIREWTSNIASGREDRRQIELPSRFEEGNSFAVSRA